MPSLWTPSNWPQRLAELQAPTGELKEAPLRRDVRSLGCCSATSSASRPATPSTTPSKPSAAPPSPAARPTPPAIPKPPRAHLQQALAPRPHARTPSTAYQLARAFGFYFELINLAETNHRKRRRLSSQLNPDAAPPARRSARNAAPPARSRRHRRRSLRTSQPHLHHSRLHRAPHRGRPPQRHVQAPPHLRPARAARPHPRSRSPTRIARARPHRRDHRPLADRRRSQRPPHRPRRDPHGARLLRGQPLRHSARPLRRGRRRPRRRVPMPRLETGPVHKLIATVSPHLPSARQLRLLDRRRPRRQSLRHPRGHARSPRHGAQSSAHPLPPPPAERLRAARQLHPAGPRLRRSSPLCSTATSRSSAPPARPRSKSVSPTSPSACSSPAS